MVVEDPLANKQVAEVAADAAATSVVQVIAPGHNVFEHKVSEKGRPIESEPAALPEVAPEISSMGSPEPTTGAEAVPIPAQPDDLVTTGDLNAANPIAASPVLENLAPDVESSRVGDLPSSTTTESPPAVHEPEDDDLARIQNQLYEKE